MSKLEMLRDEHNENIVYYVNIEKGIVTAVLKETYFEVLTNKNIQKALGCTGDVKFSNLLLPIVQRKARLCSKTLAAKATCHESDEFNLEKGIKLARKRLMRKFHKECANCLIEINNQLETYLDQLEPLIIKEVRAFDNLDEEITKIELE